MCRYISRTDHNTIYQFPGLFTNLSSISSSLYISMCFISTKPLGLFCLAPLAVPFVLMDHGGVNSSAKTQQWILMLGKTKHCSTNWGANIHQMEMAEQILISCPQEMTSFGKLEMRRCRNQRDWFFKNHFNTRLYRQQHHLLCTLTGHLYKIHNPKC